MPTSFAMQVGARATMRFVHWSYPTSCLAPENGSSFTTPTVGWLLFQDSDIRRLLRSSLETAKLDQWEWKDVGKGPGSDAGDFINWLTFEDEATSVVSDVTRIRRHPLVPSSIPIFGYVYDVRSGKLIKVPEATKKGAAQA
jgi:carbonic anhydrase